MIMPNWIKNKIIFSKKSSIDEFIDKYCSLIDNSYQFDFNKVIKMPNELEVEFSSKSMDALLLYMTKICPSVLYYGNQEDKIASTKWNTLKDKILENLSCNQDIILNKDNLSLLLHKYQDSIDEVLLLGKKQIDNILKYGYINWYFWRVFNWGTKWNATNLEINKSSNTFYFETAWTPAIPIFIEFTKQNPNYKYAMLYASENIGSYTGYVLASKGIIDYKGMFKDYSIDAYKLAIDIWNLEDKYVYDKDTNTYVLKENKVKVTA